MKKLLMILLPLVLLGAGAAVAMLGIVDVPGISPKKYGKPVKASDKPDGSLLAQLVKPIQGMCDQVLKEQKRVASLAPKAPPIEKPKDDPTRGQAKLAELWDSLDVEQLAGITQKWQPAALAPILLKMDPDQVTKFLAGLKPDRADALCKAIQSVASKPDPTPPTATS